MSINDQFSWYEQGLAKALELLRESKEAHEKLLIFESRLRENIAKTRQWGDTDALKAERNELNFRLNELILDHLNVSFNSLANKTTPSMREEPDFFVPLDFEIPESFTPELPPVRGRPICDPRLDELRPREEREAVAAKAKLRRLEIEKAANLKRLEIKKIETQLQELIDLDKPEDFDEIKSLVAIYENIQRGDLIVPMRYRNYCDKRDRIFNILQSFPDNYIYSDSVISSRLSYLLEFIRTGFERDRPLSEEYKIHIINILKRSMTLLIERNTEKSFIRAQFLETIQFIEDQGSHNNKRDIAAP